MEDHQFFDFSFYRFPTVFSDLSDNFKIGENSALNHFLCLIFIISHLWCSNLDLSELEFLDDLVFDFSNEIKNFYSMQLHTINMHQVDSHLVDIYRDLGKLENCNVFHDEGCNGELRKLVKCGNFSLEELANKNELKMVYSLNKMRKDKIKFKILGSLIVDKNSNRSFFKKIILNGELYSISCSFRSKNCFVQTVDNRFYKIDNFYKENDSYFFEGIELKTIKNFIFKYNIHRLELFYAFNVVVSSKKIIPLLEIKNKVIFNQNYNFKRFSKCLNGIVCTQPFKFNN